MSALGVALDPADNDDDDSDDGNHTEAEAWAESRQLRGPY